MLTPINKIKSFPQFLKHFNSEKKCIEYYEMLRWNGKPVCPHCGSDKKPYKITTGYKCSDNQCYKKFTVKVGTIFEGSNLPFKTWLAAIYLNTAHKKGISSVQLALDINVTQKTAWFMLHRIREMLKLQQPDSVGNINPVEIDEAHIGGVEINRHKSKKQSKDNPELANDGTVYNKKQVVIGIVERGGKIILKHVKSTEKESLMPVIKQYVPQGITIFTDEANVYQSLGKTFNHETVNHSARVYVEGKTHTNTIENFWSVLKRGINGTYHQVSEKHLNRYLNEFAARYNERNMNQFDRIELFLRKSETGLLYKNLIA